DSSVKLTVVDYNYRRRKWNDDKQKQLNILPSFYRKENLENFIVHCEILENDDFITITRIGVFIWTYKLSDIKMHYYWNDCNDRLEGFVFEKTKLKILSEKWTSGRILPASNYETIHENLDVKFGDKELFKEFLTSNIDEEFYLTCYGKILMKTLISLKDEKCIRCLGLSCMEKFVKDKNHLISKISLLSIIFESFEELSENHPAFIASVLSLIGFVVPSNTVIPDSISSHLSAYGGHYHLSTTSFLDILFSNFWNRWISFQETFQNSFQNFQENHPYFQDLIVHVSGHNLNEVLLLPEEQPSFKDIEGTIKGMPLKQIKKDIRDLPTIGQIEEVIKDLPTISQIEKVIKDLPTISQIEKVIKDLPTFKQLENDIKDLKDLKKSIEDLKTNK
ncbi:19967_t:CDS:2, partial [Dentiscutata erythropus]